MASDGCNFWVLELPKFFLDRAHVHVASRLSVQGLLQETVPLHGELHRSLDGEFEPGWISKMKFY